MNLKEINKIYNGLEIKNMPRQRFVKEVQELTNPAGVQKDLGRIMVQKQTQAIQKQKIDRAMKAK